MAIFQPAPSAVIDLIQKVIDEHYYDLKKVGVKIDAMMAHPDLDKDGEEIRDKPRIKSNGRPAWAMIRVTSAKERARGQGDAEIVIDAITYQETLTNERQRAALLCHELDHIEPVWPNDLDYKRPEGYHKKDNYGRPKLRKVQHDVEIGWFTRNVERWGEDSPEAIQAKMLMQSNSNNCIQIVLDLGPPETSGHHWTGTEESIELRHGDKTVATLRTGQQQ